MQGAARSINDHDVHNPYGHSKPTTRYVPVVVKKKAKKKTKIITIQHGFYIPNGIQMFGKFSDLHSCEKACELTPNCFAGDYNPWVKKCYAHSNNTACGNLQVHKVMTHFKKTICTVTDTPRGLVTLGIQIFKGVKVHGVKDLPTCIKKCVNLGGGIASKRTLADDEAMLCYGLDFDFANHRCYHHIRTEADHLSLCPNAATVTTSKQSVANPNSVNILICPVDHN